MKNRDTMFSSKTPEWGTPQALFDELNEEFKFNLDPCATPENAKCKEFYTAEDNGLLKSWNDRRVFCNPPYGSETGKWVAKCATGGASIAVALIPARTDTRYFHDYIYKRKGVEVRFIKGRLKFEGAQKGSGSAPFPSMIVIFSSPSKEE